MNCHGLVSAAFSGVRPSNRSKHTMIIIKAGFLEKIFENSSFLTSCVLLEIAGFSFAGYFHHPYYISGSFKC